MLAFYLKEVTVRALRLLASNNHHRMLADLHKGAHMYASSSSSATRCIRKDLECAHCPNTSVRETALGDQSKGTVRIILGCISY